MKRTIILPVVTCIGLIFTSPFARAFPVSPNAPVYTYFIINGIVRGAVMTGKLHPKDVKPLQAIDEQARRIIMHNLQQETMRSDHKASVILENYLSIIPR